jgi:tRNA1Val (adenine37-N6)-methyltransferase
MDIMFARPILATVGRKSASSVWLLLTRSERLLNDEIHPDESLDDLILGKMKVIQAREGYRFSLDAVLLAHFPADTGVRQVIELGSGSGVVSLLMAWRAPRAHITAFEVQPAMVERSRRSVLLNGLQERIDIMEADIRETEEILPGGNAELVLSNPPFWRQGEGKVSRGAEEAVARHEIMMGLPQLVEKGAYLLAPGGKMDIIHRAERLDEAMELFRLYKVPIRRLRFIHSFSDRTARLVLIEGVKYSSGPVTIMPPLIIYEQTGVYSQELRSIYGK